MTILTPDEATAPHDVFNSPGRSWIEIRRWLVKEQHLGLSSKRARQRKALLFAAGQAACGTIRQGRKANSLEQLANVDRPNHSPTGSKRIGDIGCDGSAEHDRPLENHCKPSAVRLGKSSPGDPAGGWRDETHRNTDQRTLARSIWANQDSWRT